ncbi:MAG TPA: 50S ribosomal protein L35 [Deltaproteobacteria bacterium]|nr:50S ribosomal protein L35 [Deltaproteobacteria bacterium]
MPKLKSKRGAKKRFKVTAKGKIKGAKANRRHILTTKAPKRKRQLRKSRVVSDVHAKKMRIALLA